MKKILLVAALAAAVFAPGASARHVPRVKLALLPLPASSIGPAAKSLPLQHDSGVLVDGGGDTNLVDKLYVGSGLPVAPNRSFGFIGPVFAKLGRITGYALDYGLGASGGTGITEVRTGVDEYKSAADATKGLAFWKRDDRQIIHYAGGGLAIRTRPRTLEPVGHRSFAFLVSYSDANIAPLFGVDEEFTEGRYEADVSVWAGTAAAATKLATQLAKKLDARIKQALAGRLHAKPVKLPAKQKAEQWLGGPDLSPLALKPADVGGQETAFLDNYFVGEDLFALSYFKVLIFDTGPLDVVGQEIEWFATANQASFMADLGTASFGSSPVDMSGVGDGAKAAWSSTYAAIYFSSSQFMEFVHVQSQIGSIQPSDVQNIAHRVANYINAAGLGS